MKKATISIIIPVYNAKDYLRATINSVLNQTYKYFELIFVNDGSTDGSFEILKNLQKVDDRIKIYHQENKGVTAARKLGWLKATGDYITFLDADDSFFENSLEVLIKNAIVGDFDIVNGNFISVPSGRMWENRYSNNLTKSEYLQSLIYGKTYGVLYASVYKYNIFQESTFSFDQTLKIGEDVLMNIELCSRVRRVKNINNIVYKYTDDNTLSAMKTTIRHPYYFQRYNAIRDNLIKNIDIKLFQNTKNTLEQRDSDEIINAFFSPSIKFDLECYMYVKKSRKNTNLYTLCLSNKSITLLAKWYLQVYFFTKNFILNRDYSSKNIIY